MKKILILSWSDLFGGAAQAANEIYKSLRKKKKIDFFVQNKISSTNIIKSYKKKTLNYYFRKFFSLIFYKLRFSKNDHSYNLINSDVVKIANINNYDAINLHWINSETLSIFDIAKIKKKIVLTLHDMWFLNGSEHYLYELPKQYFKSGKKIHLNTIDFLIWKLKKNLFVNKKIHIVAPSRWMAKLTKKSKIFHKSPVSIIPYPVDKKIYFKEKISSLRVNNISLKKNKNNIDLLFVSAGQLFNYRKGFDLINDCISKFEKEYNIRLIIVGSYKINDLKLIKSSYITLGKIDDKKKLSKIYNFSDILVLPSRIDNLPNVGLEAQSCGLPIVAFNVGGINDIVNHKINGYLVKPFDLKNFYNGICYCYKNLEKLQLNSLKISKKWSPEKISKQYLKLFNGL